MQDEMFDSLEGEIARLRRELAEVKAERDALAAHVEAGKELKFERHAERALNEWEKTAPTTSLARLKSEWEAEALEALGHHFMIGDSHKGFILDKAEQLRRQAEGEDHA